MLEFSISNQLLSRLDATKVVADSENYLECSFQFSQDWADTAAVATFGHSKVAEPISVRIVDGKCTVPHEVIKTYGFQLSVYGTAEEEGGDMCHIPTNAVTVEVESSGTGAGLTPAAPTKSMYDSLMAAILAGEEAVTEAKVSAQANAEMAKGAKEGADLSADKAERAAANSAISAASSAEEAMASRAIYEETQAMWERLIKERQVMESYAVGGGCGEQLFHASDIVWTEGKLEVGRIHLQEGVGRYQVRVDDTWYDVVGEWSVVREVRTDPDYSADLFPIEPYAADRGEVPEIPGGEEVLPPGSDPTEGFPVVKPMLKLVTVHDVMRLVAGPVTIEDIVVDQSTGEKNKCRITTIDSSVKEVEVCYDPTRNAKYFYEKAADAFARAEAAAVRAEAAAARAEAAAQ